MSFTFLSPISYVMDSDSVHNAIKNYIKMYDYHKIDQLIVKDREQHYKAFVKYFKHDGRNKAGITYYAIPKPKNPHFSLSLRGQLTDDLNADIKISTNDSPVSLYPSTSPVILPPLFTSFKTPYPI